MHKFSTLSILSVFISLATFAQTENNFTKQFRIESGFGYSNATENAGKGGTDFWMQFDYRLVKDFSIAMEGDFTLYKQPGYLDLIPVNPNEVNAHRNNFSLLIKYHFLTSKKVDVAVASGWTYSIIQDEYYIIHSEDSSGVSWSPNVSAYSEYRIPLVAQITYAISKKLELTSRFKFNLNGRYEDDYSAGIGLDLKL